MSGRIYNHIRDTPDENDLRYVGHLMSAAPLPYKVDLSSYYPEIYDQGQIGSCTGNSVSSVIKYTMNRLKIMLNFQTIPSRLYIYNNGKIEDGLPVDQDSGCSVRGVLKGVSKKFACDELVWPYNQLDALTTPSQAAYSAAHKYKHFSYFSVPQNLSALKRCIAQGYPIILGIQIYDSFEKKKVMSTGIIPMPNPSIEPLLGGHCINLCGYDDSTQTFLLRNSWGTSVGLPDKLGYFTIPYQYILDSNLSSDFWKITLFS
jgi:C1A family cysteine protease